MYKGFRIGMILVDLQKAFDTLDHTVLLQKMECIGFNIVIRNGYQVLFVAERELSKILVPRLPQHTSNVNIGCAGKSKHLYSLCDQLLGALIYRNFIILILICF